MQYNATFAMTGVISGTSKKKTLPRTTFSKDAGMGNFIQNQSQGYPFNKISKSTVTINQKL